MSGVKKQLVFPVFILKKVVFNLCSENFFSTRIALCKLQCNMLHNSLDILTAGVIQWQVEDCEVHSKLLPFIVQYNCTSLLFYQRTSHVYRLVRDLYLIDVLLSDIQLHIVV